MGFEEIDPDETVEIGQRVADRAEPAAFGSKTSDHRSTSSSLRARDSSTRPCERPERRDRRNVPAGSRAATPPAKTHARCCAAFFASSAWLCSSRVCVTPRDSDSQTGVDEQQRNRDTEAEHRRDHRLADALGHQARIARARGHDRAERDDHADDGADEAQQRTGRDGEPQERLEALEARDLAQHGFRDAQLGELGVLDALAVAAEREQHAAERIARFADCRGSCSCARHGETRQEQIDALEHRQQHAETADEDNRVADDFAFLDAARPSPADRRRGSATRRSPGRRTRADSRRPGQPTAAFDR